MNASATPTTAYIEPILKTIRVKASPARAFEVFTSGVTSWWNPQHSINPTKAAIDKVVLEPRVGGRWYERGVDGSECEWGRVLAWEPPSRVVIVWQVNTQWKFDANLHTEVEVHFDAQPSGETLVTLEHRYLERLGENAAAQREMMNGGWGGLLALYAAKV